MKTQNHFSRNALVLVLGSVAVIHAQANSQITAVSPDSVYPWYPIVDTGQTRCYDDAKEITPPASGEALYGQDAQHHGHQPSYTLSPDGLTVTDNVTGLTWTQSPDLDQDGDIDAQDKLTQAAAALYPDTLNAQSYGGYDDWRLPTIKELYSLMNFNGTDLAGPAGVTTALPFIDTAYFAFAYGDITAGEREIDAQFATTTLYVSTTMGGNDTMFGVNFADGRIKGYPVGRRSSASGRSEKTYFVLYVRSNPAYGQNQFMDNGDGTITDHATGLMWMKVDSGALEAGKDGAMDWQQALAFAENLDYAGYTDWRLPNAKELHSIVDYTRCPDVTDSAAVDPIFELTAIKNEAGQSDFPYYWTSTTHASLSRASAGVYIAFGRALGLMPDRRTGGRTCLDVHGAGAQRSDLKSGSRSSIPQGRGPQGDVMRTYNYVRCVRGGVANAPCDCRR